MEKLLKKCRRIVRFFHHSASAEQKLKKEQMKHLPDLKPLRLVRDVATRWNSEYDMMNRLLEVRRPLSAVLSDARMPGNLTRTEWTHIQHYCDSLKIFKEATLIATVDTAPTLSRYIPTVHMLKKILINSSQQQASNPAIDLQNNLLLGLNIRFNFIDDCHVLIMAMMLDPRFKDRLLPGEKKESAHSLLQLKIMEYAGIRETDVATASDMSETSGMLEKKLKC